MLLQVALSALLGLAAPAGDRVAASEEARCPPAAANCESAGGRVIFVESVDPDGDGDAHLVLASSEGISGPGITVVDVMAELRPDPLPGIGARVSAAGPVYRGSYGQRQIEADVLRIESEATGDGLRD